MEYIEVRVTGPTYIMNESVLVKYEERCGFYLCNCFFFQKNMVVQTVKAKGANKYLQTDIKSFNNAEVSITFSAFL